MKYIPAFLALIISSCAIAQNEPTIVEVNDVNLVNILNSVTLQDEFRGSEIVVRVYSQPGISGGAGYQNGEVLFNLYFAVSEYDELPDQSLFVLRSLQKPKVISTEDFKDFVLIKIELGGSGKSFDFKVSIEEMKMNKNASS